MPEARHCTVLAWVPLSSQNPRHPNPWRPQAEGTHITEVCGDVVGPHNAGMAQSLTQLGPQQVAALQGPCAVPVDTVQDLWGPWRLKAKPQSLCCHAAAGISSS